MYPVITISREFGSGGRDVGEKVAEMLNIPFYDGAIIQGVAEESGYTAEYISDRAEVTAGVEQWFSGAMFPISYMSNPQDQIFALQSKIVLECARKGPCVIVGRCADYVLEKADIDALNVFIHADKESRKQRVLSRSDDVPENVEKYLEKRDKGRKAYYRYYTDKKWGNYHNYQLNLDSGYLGVDFCAQIIVDTVKRREGK